MNKRYLLLYFFIFCSLHGESRNIENRHTINLQGEWLFQLDSQTEEIENNPQQILFKDNILLPGTTDTNRKGIFNDRQDETSHLSRTYQYVGKAWYKKEIEIPAEWQNKHIELLLERTKPTHIWIDGIAAGNNDNISTPQIYNLSDYLTPGKHELVIRVDNGESVPKQLLTSSHAYTESTQTNWNGIIGKIQLEAKEKLHIQNIQAYPDVTNKKVTVTLEIAHPELIRKGASVEVNANVWNTNEHHKVATKSYPLKKGEKSYTFEYPLGENAIVWSEFNPALYRLEATIKDYDTQAVNFGLRDFKVEATQFKINDNLTFLRGKHDACVFPLTGHTPMDLASWQRYFRICKEYGINHCRFHSWCPPKACFEAADIEGIYLQPELPFWGSLKKSEEYLTDYLLKEGVNIQKEYGNHASFVMFALGNELSGDFEVMELFLDTFRKVDSRHLYAFGSNNYLGYRGQLPGEDFLVTCRIGNADDYSRHTRGSFSFADAPEGGLINNTYPNSVTDFTGAIAHSTVPVISHETGQFQVYPNYREMGKYTGVVEPRNFEVFRQRLEKAGMAEQAEQFFQASGRWSAMLYKADIEMDLRTRGLAGFQLLDLQDYPGQGSAYVGMLDAFMESKELITPEEWREFCNDIVPLFITEKFCWTNNEPIVGMINIANYSPLSLKGKNLRWTLRNKMHEVLAQSKVEIQTSEKGLLYNMPIEIPPFKNIKKASELIIELIIEGTNYRNHYPLWLYPEEEKTTSSDIYISKTLDKEMITNLEKGKSVLWFPNKEEYKEQTVGGLFQTDYWNYRMFKGICDRAQRPASPGTLGILTNPEHPVFNDFPTDYHTNWQWYPIIKQSYPLILDRLPTDYKPIVQVIDNVERNHRLGLIFEFCIGKGKLLICMSDLEAVMDKPEARQLYNSILTYMESGRFNPVHKISATNLRDIFTTANSTDEMRELINISYED